MSRTKCLQCGNECELEQRDDGGYEEFWGAQVWHTQLTDVSDCCHSDDIEEIEDEEDSESLSSVSQTV